jgi:hypothetical protein
VSGRKLRLFVCAFWRAWWGHGPFAQAGAVADPDLAELLAFAERWAETGVCPTDPLPGGFGWAWHPLVASDPFDAANWTVRQTAGFKARRDCSRHDAKDLSRAAACQTSLLREILGDPYRPAVIPPCWLTPQAVALAQAAYEERAFNRLPILADALEEAGCQDAAVLAHCRQPGGHVRGCWVLDALLGRA